MKKFYQPFHLVTLSPWPILTSFSVMIMLIGSMYWFHYFNLNLSFLGFMMLIFCLFQWWRDVVRESTYQGYHTLKVVEGIKLGMILFIVSEIFFFFSIFWCYFHMFLSPSIEIGCLWPVKNIITFNPYMIPLLNTIILLSSGVSITLSHYSLINNNKKMSLISMLITIILGLIFTFFQYLEYSEAMFTITDSVYGSIFFMATGFHGLHVLIGTIFLIVNYFRINNNNYSMIHHFGFEAAAWYWHFVDVVWLFLYLLVYYWSN
uniref:Cytochrome c oxidase subunit 3 n=1 Tax=Megaphragma amalphitanum TaxID=1735703 RepID=A0A0P0CIX5_9HYME|nr:cytochrome c oxidase subunit III [Megaphragma amalphitanum]ALI86571.1 cytochrome c oxidase subunit 3 [Megaphragma amalphitanum]